MTEPEIRSRRRMTVAAKERDAIRQAIRSALDRPPSALELEPPDDDAELFGPHTLKLHRAAQRLRTATSVRDLAEVFEVLQPGRDPSRKPRLQYWVDRIGGTALEDVSVDQVDDVMMELETEPTERGTLRSGATANRFRAALASLIKFARRRRKLPRSWRSPLEDLEVHPESDGRTRYLTPAEEQRLMAAAALQRWPLMPLLVRFALVTAMRKGNIRNLAWKDVDLEKGLAIVHRDKRGRTHIGTLTPDVVAGLRAIKPQHAMQTDLVFCGREPNVPHNFTHAWYNAVREAGLEGDFTFHGLRHTSCSRLAQAGRSLLEIAEHAGHSNLSTTRRYSHLNTAGRRRMVNETFC